MKGLSKKDLAEWRKSHFKELEVCMTVAKEIRDDVESGAKNRIEAVKIIARLLDALKPEKGEKIQKIQTSGQGKAVVDKVQMERLNKLMGWADKQT